MEQEDHKYVIKKAGLRFWKIGDQGYTTDILLAKLFTLAEAKEICNRPYSDKTMHLFNEEMAARMIFGAN